MMTPFFQLKTARSNGQAMIEILILLPVLLLLLLGAANLNLLSVINGKAEIAARYSGLKHALGERFELNPYYPPANLATEVASRMEWIFYDDTLDDGKSAFRGEGIGIEGDDPDVSYVNPDLAYTPLPLNVVSWDTMFATLSLSLELIHGSQAVYAYDFPPFPFYKWILLPDAKNPDGDSRSPIEPIISVHGDFVVLADPLMGDLFTGGGSGFQAQSILLAGAGVVPVPPTAGTAFAFIIFILPFLLP